MCFVVVLNNQIQILEVELSYIYLIETYIYEGDDKYPTSRTPNHEVCRTRCQS